jgi:hypothetical protein
MGHPAMLENPAPTLICRLPLKAHDANYNTLFLKSKVGHRADLIKQTHWNDRSGSGFPAANRFCAGGGNRGWKAAPTIGLILKFKGL